MKCPNCSAEGVDGAAECRSCGLVFAKWREKVERERLAAEARLAAGNGPAASAFSRKTWIAAAGAGALLWTACLGWWYARHPARVRATSAAEKIGRYVQMRDPATGDLRRMRIERAGAPPPVPRAAPEAGRIVNEADWIEEVSTGAGR